MKQCILQKTGVGRSLPLVEMTVIYRIDYSLSFRICSVASADAVQVRNLLNLAMLLEDDYHQWLSRIGRKVVI